MTQVCTIASVIIATLVASLCVLQREIDARASAAAGVDLSVDAVIVGPSSPRAGRDMVINVALKRRGDAVDAPSHVDVLFKLDGNDLCILDARLPRGAATVYESVTVRAPAAGSHDLSAHIDPTNTLAETDESNNIRSMKFTATR